MPIRLSVVFIFLLLASTTSIAASSSPEGDSTAAEKQQHNSSVLQSSSMPDSDSTRAEIDKQQRNNLPSDVRVLIDISGSMKKTDPQNLRKPALDLIVRLLPDKSRAGVWVFGNEVNMLVPHNAVDASWRKQAAPKAEKINSVALYTNIGKALDEVSFDREHPSPNFKTHIILLTDGVVDISKEAVDNIKERQRILGNLLPGLKKSGYVIHTIALSENADADLLKKISVATDGVFTTANSAEELTSTFLKIFDQAVPADRVPLEDNGFLVDASVKEFTALIFRKPGVEKSLVLAPDGTEYSATNPKEGINWYKTDKYDLITAENPKTGQWKIKTEITPQSRITVVSNLQLVMQTLKNNIHSGNNLPLNYSFQENGKTITNVDFLNLLETNVIIAKEGAIENTTLALATPTPPADGVFHQKLDSFSEVGDYEVHVYVDGKTFKREFKHSLSVRDSAIAISKSNAIENGKTKYSYKITIDQKLVDVNKVKMAAVVRNSKNNNIDKELDLIDSNHWEFSFSPEQTAEYQVSFHAQGEMVDGDKLDETINAESFSYQEKVAIEKPVQAVKAVAPATDKNHDKIEKPVVESNNLLLYISIAVGNLLVILLGFFAYRMMMSGKAKDELSEIEKALAADIAPSAEKIADKKPSNKVEIDLDDKKLDEVDNLFPLDDMTDEKSDSGKP